MKGKEEPLRVHRVLAERKRPQSLGMRGIEGVEVPMLGRDRELRDVCECASGSIRPAAGAKRAS